MPIIKFHLPTLLPMLTLLCIGCSSAQQNDSSNSPTQPPPTRIAFTGDMGVGANARAVLNLIKQDNADMLLVQGDLGYDSNYANWITLVENVFDDDFPILMVAGNHDDETWFLLNSYAGFLNQRLPRYKEVHCLGTPGIQATCTYRGIFMAFIGIGLSDFSPNIYSDANHIAYLKDRLDSGEAKEARWRICSWHLLMHKMQVGAKPDESGWEVYEECRKHGAIIATAHEHSYQRTVSLAKMETQQVHNPDKLRVPIGPGYTFAFVSGLGGASIRDQQLCGIWPNDTCGYWGMIDTRSQNANYGALFCDFYSKALPKNQASCYFKNIDGVVRDSFIIENEG